MCGRTACSLAPDDICQACGHKDKNGKWAKPRWRDPPGRQKYYTSYNIAPGAHTPVLLSKKHAVPSDCEPDELSESGEESLCDWIVQPMQWGLVPSWHQGDPKEIMYKMNNARSDGMLSKRSFKGPLEKGQRCVVVVDGYYEWQTKDGKKQPYFIYFPSSSSTKVEGIKEEALQTHDEPYDVWTGRRMLTMAGLFDVWKKKNSDKPLYSYSIITVDSHKTVEWIHHRMPAILNGEEEVQAWLDFGSVPLQKAVELIRPVDCIQLHPVTKSVNNATYKEPDCVKEIDLEKQKEKEREAKGSSKMMMAWLGKGKKTEPKAQAKQEVKIEENDQEPALKKPKLEN